MAWSGLWSEMQGGFLQSGGSFKGGNRVKDPLGISCQPKIHFGACGFRMGGAFSELDHQERRVL